MIVCRHSISLIASSCVLIPDRAPRFHRYRILGILIADVRRQRRLDQILCDLSRAFACETCGMENATRAFESPKLVLSKISRSVRF